MNSYAALFVLLNFAGGYFCLRMGRRSRALLIVLLPASIVWGAAIVIQQHALIESPIWLTDPAILWAIGTSFVPMLGSLAALWIVLRQRRFMSHLRAGRCINCGYDLRFVKRSVCPECGNPV